MRHEFHAHYSYALQDDVTQGIAIGWLASESGRLPVKWKEIETISDPIARLDILSQAMVTGFQNQARSGTRRNKSGYQYWVEKHASEFIKSQMSIMRNLGIDPRLPEVALLPTYSWGLQFRFRLRTPYISKDDAVFHILENPLKKEWVFKIPYVAPSQWKGALRAAMRTERRYDSLEDEAKDDQMKRLFGNVRSEDASFSAGQLYFFPTYFDNMGFEIINPHDRETVAGSSHGPILLECAPAGSTGVFTLIYVPGAAVKQDDEHKKLVIGDLKAVIASVKAMMFEYGLGAKTSSGYGQMDSILQPTKVAIKNILMKPVDFRSFETLDQIIEKLL